MNIKQCIYNCPITRCQLRCTPEIIDGDNVLFGSLDGARGSRYPIRNGIPLFVDRAALGPSQRATLDYYDSVAEIYDDVAGLTFRIQYVDEVAARKRFIEPLLLTPGSRVLEIACGTGRDSINIASQLDETGQLYLQDISESMLKHCQEKLATARVPTEFLVANACTLPFPDNYFDAVFSFGGLCVFEDIKQSLQEIVRVSKVGGRVAVGDESLAPWLCDSEYGRILLNNNPLFKAELPLRHLPLEARETRVQWVVGGVYFLIDFTVGLGEPLADFDLEIPGRRGGTLRTRYHGKLEGVTPETLTIMEFAAEKAGQSRHQWLESAIRQCAQDQGHLP